MFSLRRIFGVLAEHWVTCGSAFYDMSPSCDFLVMLDRMAEKGIVPVGLTAGQRAAMIAHGMIKLADPKTRVKSSDFYNKAKMAERISRDELKQRERRRKMTWETIAKRKRRKEP